ncbi:MAG: DUF1289 domain-containing protein [Oceanospirillaceae bacterium]|uniref:DUF1289 domain-containing protein n=1 Tax=unclassified Thalassolituus TaxID=2624967 RepID=UPI000C0A3ECD|nr:MULTISPECIES: DUF1289 domain-containing protein [unclassified Thalassolituus]MAK90904.1 DUF1289 domain-containing protein [Thalassolituus sp.]MBS53569.1 DUF1289 domain-containing protein [Oceanospirillaceae bacterium]|tara:strand:- start:864 stop:1067 length:204 start_codon:yes stop_codon:yes gene_type:complete
MSGVKSPCVCVCALDDDNICMGCQRTGEEISRWGSYSDDEKREVMKKVAVREQAAMNFMPVTGTPES